MFSVGTVKEKSLNLCIETIEDLRDDLDVLGQMKQELIPVKVTTVKFLQSFFMFKFVQDAKYRVVVGFGRN